MHAVGRLGLGCRTFTVSLAALAVSTVARADPPARTWDDEHAVMVHVPITLSFGFPFGSLDGNPLDDFAASSGYFTSFGLGVGVRVRKFLADLMFEIGGASVQGPIANGISAAGYTPNSTLRVFAGADVAYYPVRLPSWAPWVGLRVGYESLDFHGSQDRRDAFDVNYGSFYLAARAGIDWRIVPAFGLGVYVELGMGLAASAWTSVSHTADPNNPSDYDTSTSAPIDMMGTAVHGLGTVGIRTVFFP